MFRGKKGIVFLCLLLFILINLTAFYCPNFGCEGIVDNRLDYDICLIIFEGGKSREIVIEAGKYFNFKLEKDFEGITIQRCSDRALYHYTDSGGDLTKIPLDCSEVIVIDEDTGYWVEP